FRRVLFRSHLIQQTTQKKSEYQQENRRILAHFSWAKPTYCMLLTNVAPFKREINRLSNGISCIAKKHCYNKEIIYQTHISLLFVLCLYLKELRYLAFLAANFRKAAS